MKRILKRAMAVMMTAVMLLTATPLSGFVGLDIDFGWFDFSTKASALDSSGSCGENVTYTFSSSTGRLIISGTGAMSNDSIFKENAVIVSGKDEKHYHKYGCAYCDTESFWIYNTEAAEDEGIKRCPYCFKN